MTFKYDLKPLFLPFKNVQKLEDFWKLKIPQKTLTFIPSLNCNFKSNIISLHPFIEATFNLFQIMDVNSAAGEPSTSSSLGICSHRWHPDQGRW